MKRLLISILVTGAFLGGYHAGRQPGSPDIFGWARRNVPAMVQAGREVIDSLTAGRSGPEHSPATGGLARGSPAGEPQNGWPR